MSKFFLFSLEAAARTIFGRFNSFERGAVEVVTKELKPWNRGQDPIAGNLASAVDAFEAAESIVVTRLESWLVGFLCRVDPFVRVCRLA